MRSDKVKIKQKYFRNIQSKHNLDLKIMHTHMRHKLFFIYLKQSIMAEYTFTFRYRNRMFALYQSVLLFSGIMLIF